MSKFEVNLERGLFAHNPTEFNIDKKLRPKDPLKLLIDGKLLSKNIEGWITADPVRLWLKIYKPKIYWTIYRDPLKLEVRRLSLCKNSHEALVNAVKRVQPELIEEVEEKKKKERLLKKYAAGKLKPLQKGENNS
jgi:hypothetical protein